MVLDALALCVLSVRAGRATIPTIGISVLRQVGASHPLGSTTMMQHGTPYTSLAHDAAARVKAHAQTRDTAARTWREACAKRNVARRNHAHARHTLDNVACSGAIDTTPIAPREQKHERLGICG